MTKASDNAFPSLLITEGTEPSAPAAGKQRLYIDSSSHHLMRTNSSGTETDLETNQSAAATVAAHACRVHRASGDVALGNNTYTVITWDAEDHDTDSMHDNSTNSSRIVIPSISGVTTGLWAMSVVGYSNATSGRTDAMFRANANAVNSGGTKINEVVGGPITASGVSAIQAYAEWVLSGGDYIECFMRTTSGSFSLKFDSAYLPTMSVSFLGKVS